MYILRNFSHVHSYIIHTPWLALHSQKIELINVQLNHRLKNIFNSRQQIEVSYKMAINTNK